MYVCVISIINNDVTMNHTNTVNLNECLFKYKIYTNGKNNLTFELGKDRPSYIALVMLLLPILYT